MMRVASFSTSLVSFVRCERRRSGGSGLERRTEHVHVRRRRRPGFFPVDLVLLVHQDEQIRVISDAFGVAEHQKSPGLQRVVKHRQQLPLKRAVHVDQHVPTAYQIEMRERRVARQILPREHAHIADRFGHLIAAVGLREEPPQPLRRHVVGNRRGVQPLARKADGAFADVGPENLHAAFLECVAEDFADDDRERIHFFARRAAGHPHAQRCARRDRRTTAGHPAR